MEVENPSLKFSFFPNSLEPETVLLNSYDAIKAQSTGNVPDLELLGSLQDFESGNESIPVQVQVYT